jgi:hypothetical protein
MGNHVHEKALLIVDFSFNTAFYLAQNQLKLRVEENISDIVAEFV